MLTDGFCVLCGDFAPTEVHHVVPRVHGGSDDKTNLLSFCSPCHARVHSYGVKRGSMLELQREGINRARAEGKYTGRKPVVSLRTNEVAVLLEMGFTKQQVADQMGIGVASVYRMTRGATP